MMTNKRSPPYDAAKLEAALRRYFRRRAASSEIDDLVQEVFIRLQSRRSDEAVEDIDRYVFVIAASVLMRRYRKDRQWTRSVGRASDDYHEEPISPERVLLGRERLNVALAVLKDLPPRTRQIFVLH